LELASGKPHNKTEQTIRDRAITQLIVTQNLPLALVASDDFKQYAAIMDPRWVVPTRERVKDLLDNGFDRIRALLRRDLKSASTISVSADMWTASSRDGYLGVTAAWVNDRFELNSCILAFSRICYPHSGEVIASRLANIFRYWKIDQKVFTLTTDRATNMKSACTRLGVMQVECCAHTLNLIVKKGLLPAEQLIARMKRLISFFTTPKQGERLAAVQASTPNLQKGKTKETANSTEVSECHEIVQLNTVYLFFRCFVGHT
jgi:hypothetical protein